MTDDPTISVVIVNYNGKQHLKPCIDSLKNLCYPCDKIEIIVVDNGSKDGSVELLRERYGFVKLITNARNEGFAKPSNDGARAAKGEYIAFLNNDMRVDKNWLRELLASMERSGARCAGSLILSWDGKSIDFAGGSVNFYGLGYQDDFKKPLSQMKSKIGADREILFACGGAMLVDRAVFLEAGGFDEDYFAYYEDVDLGWRLHVLGCKVVLSVDSRVCHRHNSTSKLIARERVQYLFERNKLYSIYKNYGDSLFNKIFFATLLLDIREMYLHGGVDGDNYRIENPAGYDDNPVHIDHYSALKLAALNDFVAHISKMEGKRRFIQGNRRTPDGEILKFMENPFMAFPKDSPGFISTEYDLIRTLGIDRAFGRDCRRKVLVVSDGGLSEEAGSRSFAFAHGLQDTGLFNVVLACEDGKNANGSLETVVYSSTDIAALLQAATEAGVIILTPETAGKMPALGEIAVQKFVVSDLWRAGTIDGAAASELSKLGDLFVCVDAAQRQSLTSALAALPCGKDEQGAVPPHVEILPAQGEEEGETFTAFIQSLSSFCANPLHAYPRSERGHISLLYAENADEEEEGEPADSGEASLLERLKKIETGQEKLKRMLRDDMSMEKRTQEEVLEVRKWTGLMDSRFMKLKSRLGRVKILKKFIN